MPETSRRLRVFLASPGDVSKERERAEDVVNEINRLHGEDEGFHLKLVRWEKDSYPQLGRPQDVLNEQLRPEVADIFIGIMWKRFGQPTEKAGSGTEEEFQRAYDAYQSGDGPEILFFFCDRAVPTSTDTQQLQKVQSFREKFQRLGLYQTYETVDDFTKELRKALVKATRSLPAKGEDPNVLDDVFRSVADHFHQEMQRVNLERGPFSVFTASLHSRDLEAVLLRIRGKVNHCYLTVGGIGGMLGYDEPMGDGVSIGCIYYSEGKLARSGAVNDYVMIERSDGAPSFVAGGMSSLSTHPSGTRLDPEGAARYFWERFLRPMMH